MLIYTIIPKGSAFFHYYMNQPISHTLNLTLSKKFLNNQLNISLFANDVFDTNRIYTHTQVSQPVYVSMKKSSRQFGISVNYKIPTKNKLAREEKSNLTPDKSGKDKGGFMK